MRCRVCICGGLMRCRLRRDMWGINEMQGVLAASGAG